MLIKVSLLFFTCFLSGTLLFAQESVRLDSIEVTASRITSTVSESGKHVSVITRAQIERMPVTSVDELLRSLPGINMNSRQGFGVQADVGIRGSTYSQVLFLLDNVPLNDPLTAHFNTNIPVSLAEIGQIEVIRGPASASYGADAVGGVVHIKTRMYMEREVEKTGDALSRVVFDAAGGQHSLLSADGAVEVDRNRLRIGASFRTISSDGERLQNPGFIAGISDRETYRNYFDITNVSAALSYRASDEWSFYVRGGLDERDFSARYFYTRSILDESVEEISSRWALTSLTRNSGLHRTELNASWHSVDDRFDFNSRIGVPVNEHTTDRLFLNLSHQVSASAPGATVSRVMVGLQLNNYRIRSTDRGNHEDLMGGAYLIAQLYPTAGLSLTASARVQFDTRGKAEFLPQLSTAYTMGTVTIRSSAGRAIRVGDFTERYISTLIPVLTPGRNIGNPDLAPERSYTIDAGTDWRLSERFIISATGFYRTSSNLIDYVLTNSNQIGNAGNLMPNELYFYSQNISKAQTSGIELFTTTQFRLSPQSRLGIEKGYTFIRTTADTGEVSKYIANHPSHQLTFALNLTAGRVNLNSQSSYRVRSTETADIIGAKVPGSYFVTNLNLEVRIAGSAILYGKVLNLTDTSYQEILGPPMPGRWVMSGIRLNIR
jgi:vitamin B12 transporter